MSDHVITRHPSWCSPSECSAENDLDGFGAHRSAPVTLAIGFQVLTDVSSVRVQLHQSGANWPTLTYVSVEAGRGRAMLELSTARAMHRELGALLGAADEASGDGDPILGRR